MHISWKCKIAIYSSSLFVVGICIVPSPLPLQCRHEEPLHTTFWVFAGNFWMWNCGWSTIVLDIVKFSVMGVVSFCIPAAIYQGIYFPSTLTTESAIKPLKFLRIHKKWQLIMASVCVYPIVLSPYGRQKAVWFSFSVTHLFIFLVYFSFFLFFFLFYRGAED